MFSFKKNKDNDGEPSSDISRPRYTIKIRLISVLILVFMAACCLFTIKWSKTAAAINAPNDSRELSKYDIEQTPAAETVAIASPELSLPEKPLKSCITMIDQLQIQVKLTQHTIHGGSSADQKPASTSQDFMMQSGAAKVSTVPDSATQDVAAKDSAAPDVAVQDVAATESAAESAAEANNADSFVYNSNIPLSDENQQYLYDLCQQRNLDYRMVLAIIRLESGFNPKAVGGGSNYGLFQINICHHRTLSATLQTANAPFDPKTNINWGTYLLSCLYPEYSNSYTGEDLTKAVLSAYNMGEDGFATYGFATTYINEYDNALGIINSWFE